jgi:hypothetical protein
MKVKALTIGEHPQGRWRKPGEVFDFKGTEKELGKWMKPTDEKAPAKKAPAKKKAKDDDKGGDKDPKHHTVHKGFGKWDVFGPDGEVVDGGDNLGKEDAAELVEKLNAESEE